LTVLLLAFGGNATYTLVTIHRARQGVVANEAYLELQGSIDAAWKSLNDFAPSLGRNLRLDPNLALAFRMARKQLDDAVGAIDRYLEKEPSSRSSGGRSCRCAHRWTSWRPSWARRKWRPTRARARSSKATSPP
jgi:hypothetical protein